MGEGKVKPGYNHIVYWTCTNALTAVGRPIVLQTVEVNTTPTSADTFRPARYVGPCQADGAAGRTLS